MLSSVISKFYDNSSRIYNMYSKNLQIDFPNSAYLFDETPDNAADSPLGKVGTKFRSLVVRTLILRIPAASALNFVNGRPR